jgi:hypothetical protein
MLANRLLPGLDAIISNNQAAFVTELAQELVCDWHKEKGIPRCTLKVDLMKAYDSVDWDFILFCFQCLRALAKFV